MAPLQKTAGVLHAFFANPDHQAIMADMGVDASSVRIEVYQD